MRIKIFLLLVISISLNTVNAQKLGIRVGGNLSNTKVDLDDIEKKSKLGFNLGVISNFNLPLNGWKISTGLLFANQRFTLKEDYGNDRGITYNFITNSIEVPVNVRKEFDLIIVKQFIQAGLYSSYDVYGKIKDEGTKHSLDFKKNSDRFNTGFTIGIGSYLTKNIQILVNYDHGLTESNINFGDQVITLKKRKWVLSAEYTF